MQTLVYFPPRSLTELWFDAPGPLIEMLEACTLHRLTHAPALHKDHNGVPEELCRLRAGS